MCLSLEVGSRCSGLILVFDHQPALPKHAMGFCLPELELVSRTAWIIFEKGAPWLVLEPSIYGQLRALVSVNLSYSHLVTMPQLYYMFAGRLDFPAFSRITSVTGVPRLAMVSPGGRRSMSRGRKMVETMVNFVTQVNHSFQGEAKVRRRKRPNRNCSRKTQWILPCGRLCSGSGIFLSW